MKKSLIKSLLFVLIFCCSLAQSQETGKSKIIQITLYMNGFYTYDLSSEDNNQYDWVEYYFRDEKYEFGNPSIACEINEGGFIAHEFELMPLDIEHDNELHFGIVTDTNLMLVTAGEKLTTIKSALRYQATHYFIQGKLFQPYIALSSQLFYDLSQVEPRISTSFFTNQNTIGLLFSVIPGVEINLTKKVALDINIPLAVYDFRYIRKKNENPLVAEEDKKETRFENNFIPNFAHVRIGISYTIN